MTITVHNMHHYKNGGIVRTEDGQTIWPVHRPFPLGNPYRPGIDNEPIQQYKRWLWQGIKNKDGRYHELLRLARAYQALGSLHLGCWCKPKPCHGDIVASAIDYIIDQGLPTKPKSIALIGPRKISLEMIDHLGKLGAELKESFPDAEFRSGGAPGSDQAWANGVEDIVIFLPWPRFEQGSHPRKAKVYPQTNPRALAWANWNHSGYSDKISRGVRALTGRNWHILFRDNLSTTVDLVFYAHTNEENSEPTGGTANAVRAARAHGIPCEPVLLSTDSLVPIATRYL